MTAKPNQINLVERLQNPDDHQAWQEFDKTYRALIFNSALYYGISAKDAEDFTQSFLLKLWNKLQKSIYKNERGNFQTWLKKVIHNSAMDFHRKTYREFKNLESIPEFTEESELDLIEKEEWENYNLKRIMKNIHEHFNDKAIKVFQLCLEGWSPADISSHMNIKENTIYQLRRRVKMKIINEFTIIP